MKKLIYPIIAMLVILSSCGKDDDPSTKSLTLNISGLADLGSQYVYEGWVIVDGSPVSTGTFTVDGAGKRSASSFDVAIATLADASKFVLTIEPKGGAVSTPSAQKLLAGDFVGNTATVSTATAPALGDFSKAAGVLFLRSPTDEAPDAANNMNDENGIWFGMPGMPGMPPTAGFTLPTLPTGWVYEGWVIGDAVPISTGRFTDFGMKDSENPHSSPVNLVSPPIPGEDFFKDAPAGETFPLDVRGRTIVISVEPEPDNSRLPFLLKPLKKITLPDAATATVFSFDPNLGSLPKGTVTR